MSGATATYSCKACTQSFTARVADRKRGWARFCSKSCKAARQTRTSGWLARYEDDYRDTRDDFAPHPFSDEAFSE